jgi:feruloyl esterase
MKLTIGLPLLASALLAAGCSAFADDSCEKVAAAKIPGATVTLAQAVAAGAFTGPAEVFSGRDMSAFYKKLPAFCRVVADAKPTADSDIKLEVWLPASGWNGKLQGIGNGGFAGLIDYVQIANAMSKGYAATATDTGHAGKSPVDADWAIGHPEKVADFGHRGIHEMTRVAKAVVQAYYAKAAQRSYFAGCSDGGREALMEAQRYPADFDGIVAIAPAFNFLEIAAGFIRNLQAQYPTGNFSAPVVTPAVLRLLAAKVTERCDAIDGVRDGTLENPEACAFNLASLPACANDVTMDGCVTRAQRAALAAFTSPMTAGTLRYPGWPIGDDADPEGRAAWMTGPVASMIEMAAAPTLQGVFATQFFKYFVYADSAWSYVGYDLARAGRDGANSAAAVSATNPDLSAFRARGGKLLLAHGWSDPALSARSTIEYFNAVQRRTPHASSFTRLFLMPGVLHCGGGSGCDDVDYAGVIRRWVDQGEAPSRIIARKLRGTQVVRTHPLCAYPMTARYNGTGSTDDAAAFTCR